MTKATVLLVDDEPNLVRLYAEWVKGSYDVRTATSGAEALELIDDVEAALLDRRMPGMSGDELLDEIRDRGYDCPIAMVTAVDPDRDVVELPFDKYVTKPVEKADLLDALDGLLEISNNGLNNTVLDTLGDPKARHCYSLLTEAPDRAQSLANRTGYSASTVYRRLNKLHQAGLIESRYTYDADGNHYKTFEAVTDTIKITVNDGFQVQIDRTPETGVFSSVD